MTVEHKIKGDKMSISRFNKTLDMSTRTWPLLKVVTFAAVLKSLGSKFQDFHRKGHQSKISCFFKLNFTVAT